MSSDFADFWQKHTGENLQHDSDYSLVKKLVVFLWVDDQLNPYTTRGGKITPQATCAPVSLEPRKMELCIVFTVYTIADLCMQISF